MSGFTGQWIAYAVLFLQAIVFIFFLLMLITKIVEAIIRLVGGVPFDESTHPLDGGLFGAIADLDCLNPRGGKAAQRRRRKRGSKQLQRNVSAAGSLTTQMMLDRHSQGVMRPLSEGNTPFFAGRRGSIIDSNTSYFPSIVPPLGPPPLLERRSSESKFEEPHGGETIMGAWQPAGASNHQSNQITSPTSPHSERFAESPLTTPLSTHSPARSFSVVRGGRADFNNPYTVQGHGRSPVSPTPDTFHDPINPPLHPGSIPPPIRMVPVGQPLMPAHSRLESSHAVIERFDSRPTPPVSPLYPPGHQGMRSPGQGQALPALTIPTRRSLNNLRGESPVSDGGKGEGRGAGSKKKKRASFWGKSEKPAEDTESDDEPGPSSPKPKQPKRHSKLKLSPEELRNPAPFQPVPLVIPAYLRGTNFDDHRSNDNGDEHGDRDGDDTDDDGQSRRGWKGLFSRRKRRAVDDDVSEQIKDENKARKAALATESGSMLVGVTPTPKETRSFVVKRATGSPSRASSPSRGPESGPGSGSGPILFPSPIATDPQTHSHSTRKFTVKRVPQSIASPTVVVPPNNAIMGGKTVFPMLGDVAEMGVAETQSNNATPVTGGVTVFGRSDSGQEKETISSAGTSGTNISRSANTNGGGGGSDGGGGKASVRSFKVIRPSIDGNEAGKVQTSASASRPSSEGKG